MKKKRVHPVTGKPVCGADRSTPNKFNVFFCCAKPMPNGKCHKHGGATPHGIASPHYKHGGRSRYLPPGLLDKYEEALNDPDLLNLKNDIALTDARIGDLLSRLDRGDAGERWLALQKQYEAFNDHLRKKDGDKSAEALNAMGEIIQQGAADYALWDNITNLVNERRKLVDTERKRRIAMEQMLTYEQALLLVGALSAILREEVTDAHVLSRIQTRLTRLLNQRSGATALTERGHEGG